MATLAIHESDFWQSRPGVGCAGTINEAAEAEIVLLPLPWSQVPTLKNVTDRNSKTVIGATNHFISCAPEFKVADVGDRASNEVVASLLPGAKIVKAFNTIYYKILAEDPKVFGGNRVLFVSGDHQAAKGEVITVKANVLLLLSFFY